MWKLVILIVAHIGTVNGAINCTWSPPSVKNLNFSVTCEAPSGSQFVLQNELCGPHKPWSVNQRASGFVEEISSANGTSKYTATVQYAPYRVGLYEMSVSYNDNKHSFPYAVSPIITITAIRKHQRDRDVVTCNVTGIFERGRFSILRGPTPIMSADVTVQGTYINTRKKSLVLRYENGNMIFEADFLTKVNEKQYRCGFTAFTCDYVTGYSNGWIMESSDVFDVARPYLDSGSICCSVDGVVETVSWYKIDTCNVTTSVVEFAVPKDNDVEYRTWDTDTDVTAMALSTNPETIAGSAIYTCLRKYTAPLQPAMYQCVFVNKHGKALAKAIRIPGRIDIRVTYHPSGMQIACGFDTSVRGRLEIRRSDNGVSVLTMRVPVGIDRPLDTEVTVERNKTYTIVKKVISKYIGHDFRCEVTDKCSYATSISQSVHSNPENKNNAVEPKSTPTKSPDISPSTLPSTSPTPFTSLTPLTITTARNYTNYFADNTKQTLYRFIACFSCICGSVLICIIIGSWT
uniref:Membrane protein m138 n=1 Tax=Mastomys natalensis cytomegalovirus 2 TaxID=2973540 RepID=A0A9Y1IMT1_9BETA|nr:membrane protein m138 [Mastomys natalensis cytomegalovirus 2]WEG69264.1 membrane protein m138 [Mastomys natalensis cytomegalovirus 2]WEG69403.1 membrane protein m138 [Mastomys natalensis cytomegalovirus 2]WEG69541.1 membrane protein m138 [Mastomys natalensis cytomegalovirus 2]WEG69679.1 membrane protein m138 [Mastomys natalensis cytomegalovirus 2]